MADLGILYDTLTWGLDLTDEQARAINERATKVRQGEQTEQAAAAERGYQTGFKDAKNEAAIAIEALKITDDEETG